MTGTIINANLRRRILACADLADFLAEKTHLEMRTGDRKGAEFAGDCERFMAWFGDASSVREKLQILSLCRERRYPTPLVGGGELLGVVIELGNEFGVDALAVYSDLQGAWYSGRDSTLTEVDLSAGSRVAYQQLRDVVNRGMQHCMPHPTEIPLPPPPGYTVISFLSESGIAYALGSSRDMASDGISGPIIYSALAIRKLILGSRSDASCI